MRDTSVRRVAAGRRPARIGTSRRLRPGPWRGGHRRARDIRPPNHERVSPAGRRRSDRMGRGRPEGPPKLRPAKRPAPSGGTDGRDLGCDDVAARGGHGRAAGLLRGDDVRRPAAALSRAFDGPRACPGRPGRVPALPPARDRRVSSCSWSPGRGCWCRAAATAASATCSPRRGRPCSRSSACWSSCCWRSPWAPTGWRWPPARPPATVTADHARDAGARDAGKHGRGALILLLTAAAQGS